MASAQDVLGTYSPEDLLIHIAVGDISHTVSGYGDGTFINISQIVPASTLYTGSDNTNVRVVRANTANTITLTLHQGSESNDVLSELLRRDRAARDGTWVFSIMIKDLAGRSTYFSPSAFISGVPDSTFGAEIDVREWTIQCTAMDSYLGGNAKFSADTYATLQDLESQVESRWAPNQTNT